MSRRRPPLSRRRRFAVLERCGYKCVYCGRGPKDGAVLQVDHALPVACGGGDEDDNLVASCVDCNYGKRDRVVALPALSNTFLGWLRTQRTRDDPIGDLARDEGRDKLVEPASFKHLARQLRAFRACKEAMWAAWHAWREYRRGGKPTIAVERDARAAKKDLLETNRETTCVWRLGEPS
jgi:hypothetical protein